MMSEYKDQPMQLRINFTTPTKPLTIHLSLSGLSILVEATTGSMDEAFHYLTYCGIAPVVDEVLGIYFPAKFLAKISELPEQVNLASEPSLAPLIAFATNPSPDNSPATLSVDPSGPLYLSWFDGRHNWSEPFEPVCAPVLLESELSFVATSEAWELLKKYCRLPVLVGKAQENLDGYIEIMTTKPQLVETSPLPGLFRIDDTHFGLALAYAANIDMNPGFIWEGHKPVLERGPLTLPDFSADLSSDHLAYTRDVLDALTAYRARVIVSSSDVFGKFLPLAAIEALDAWPLLIVTTPAGVWSWQRHLDAFGKTYSLSHDRADVAIITYLDLAKQSNLLGPQAIIFDDLESKESATVEAVNALHRLDGMLGAYRIATVKEWPSSLKKRLEIMSFLRPGEFKKNLLIPQRYPVDPDVRANEHINAYLSLIPETTSHLGLHAAEVIVVGPTKAQKAAFAETVSKFTPTNPAAILAEVLETISAGPTHSISPKIAVAASLVKDALEGEKIAVLTKYRRTSLLMKAALRPSVVQVVDALSPEPLTEKVVIVRYDDTLPSLRSFDKIIVIDYPWSTEVLEKAVGASFEKAGPGKIICIHMEGTVDDRVAMLAARRRELGSVLNVNEPLQSADIAYLLSPRYADSP